MDREKVIKGLEEAEIMLIQAVDRGGEMAVMGAFKCLNRVTDALALLKEQEAKTGEWIPVTNGRGGMECSICHDYAPSYQNCAEYLSKYCPNCGAKMEGR